MQDTESESKKKENPVQECVIELTMATGAQGPVGLVNGHLSSLSLSKCRLNFC